MVEKWARAQLRAAWGLSHTEMRESWGSSLWLDHGRRIELIPDLGVQVSGAWRFVGDVKYKALDESGAKQDDVYQMLAYLTATGLPSGGLIYVGVDGRDENLLLPHVGKSIRVLSVDLNGPDPRRELIEKATSSAMKRLPIQSHEQFEIAHYFSPPRNRSSDVSLP